MPVAVKASGLSTRDMVRLIEAGIIVVLVRIGLCIAGYARTQRWALAAIRPLRRLVISPDPETTAACRAIMSVSAMVPGATCLTQAIAAQAMLARRNVTGRICFGVNRNLSPVRAHAWLEDAEGNILVGHADLSQFVRLSNVGGSAGM